MAYRIVTDTGCDFPQHMYEEKGLVVVPLIVNYKGQEYNSYSESWLQEMYAGLRSGESATTAAVNPEGWATAIEPILAAGEDALVLPFSSGLSTTYQSAVIAANELREKYPERKILTVDTLSAASARSSKYPRAVGPTFISRLPPSDTVCDSICTSISGDFQLVSSR